MIQSAAVFPLPVQAAAQPVTDSPVVPKMQSAAAWIDDVFALYTFGY